MNKEEKLQIFANNLRRARENTGLSKPETAKKLNIKPAQYYRYEAGKAEPGILMAIEIANLFQVTTTDLFDGIESNVSKADYIITKLRGYGVNAMTIEGKPERILLQFKNSPPSDVSIDIMDRVISIAEDHAKQIMKDSIPQAFFKVLFDLVDRDAVAKQLQDSLAKLKNDIAYEAATSASSAGGSIPPTKRIASNIKKKASPLTNPSDD
ncbi:MAG: helix-turn-helix transcriptional regulator [Acidaminococcaceae bacterium]|nr:helix-turn-helix transcriptional regulator [Acidaminococcaceae bacterium]